MDTSDRIHRSQVQNSEASLTHNDHQASENSTRFAEKLVKPYEVDVMDFEPIFHLFHRVETSLLL